MKTVWHDLRYALRMLAKNPGLTAMALITLALGVGVNTAMFSFINAMKVTPQRFENPDDLAFVWGTHEESTYRRHRIGALDYLDWCEQTTAFQDLALLQQGFQFLTGDGDPERVDVMQATANFLPVLGVGAQIGRIPGDGEDSADAEDVVVLTDQFWQRRYNGDVNVLGTTVTLNDMPHTIVGVLPPKIDFEQFTYGRADMLTPFHVDAAKHERGQDRFQCVARLQPGTSIQQAQAEMSAISARLADAYPDTNEKKGVWIQPLTQRYFSVEDQLASYALLATVGCILLIACVNLANLLLARATARGREFAIRTALGAGRGRIIQQLLTEAILLALLGGAVGTLAGIWLINILAKSIPDLPFRPEDLGLHPAVLAYSLLISIAAALVFGLAPALTASKVSLNEALKEGGTSGSTGVARNRLRSTLAVGQLALTLPLIICAGLVIRHLIALKTVDVGFDTERLLVMQVDLPSYRYENDAARTTFFHEAVMASNATPGVESAAAVGFVPLGGSRMGMTVTIEGRPEDETTRRDSVGLQVVTPNYFKTMGIPLLAGRAFADYDHAESQRVVVVNQLMATQYWPNDDAVGKRLRSRSSGPDDPWMMVVGVIGDTGHSGLYQTPQPDVYFPLRQRPRASMTLVARTVGDPTNVISSLREGIRRMDADLPVYGVRTMEQIIHRWMRDDRSAVWFLGGLAALALSLATVGLYGVMSYSVAQRTHEIGVRAALGAQSRDIQRLVIKRCVTLGAMGVGVGLVLSVAVGLVLQSQLYGVSGVDPLTFIAVSALLLAVSAGAGYLPARRATKVDPLVALRYE